MGGLFHFRQSLMSAFGGIVLQKSKVAGLRNFRENTKREAIADSNGKLVKLLVEARHHYLKSLSQMADHDLQVGVALEGA